MASRRKALHVSIWGLEGFRDLAASKGCCRTGPGQAINNDRLREFKQLRTLPGRVALCEFEAEVQAYVEASNTSSTWVKACFSPTDAVCCYAFSEGFCSGPGQARKQSQLSCCCALCARSHRPADDETTEGPKDPKRPCLQKGLVARRGL